MRTQMNDGEELQNYFQETMSLINQMKSCGEKITELQKCEKVLRDITTKSEHIVVAIKE